MEPGLDFHLESRLKEYKMMLQNNMNAKGKIKHPLSPPLIGISPKGKNIKSTKSKGKDTW